MLVKFGCRNSTHVNPMHVMYDIHLGTRAQQRRLRGQGADII